MRFAKAALFSHLAIFTMKMWFICSQAARSSICGDYARRISIRGASVSVYIDSGPEPRGFVEDGWLGGELEIGGSGVRIAGMRPALRCAMTIHPQEELRADPAILRTAAQHHDAYVGVFASVASPGLVRVGDPVWLDTHYPREI